MTRRTRDRALLVVAALACVAAVPLASGASAAKYSVKAVDFKFTGMPKTVKAGTHTFTLVNNGPSKHDLKVGAKKTKMLRKGKKGAVTVTLEKGKVTFLCTVPGHAALGMKGKLTVK